MTPTEPDAPPIGPEARTAEDRALAVVELARTLRAQGHSITRLDLGGGFGGA